MYQMNLFYVDAAPVRKVYYILDRTMKFVYYINKRKINSFNHYLLETGGTKDNRDSLVIDNFAKQQSFHEIVSHELKTRRPTSLGNFSLSQKEEQKL